MMLSLLSVSISRSQSPEVQDIEWETYTAHEYNWSIKYPAGWNVLEFDSAFVMFMPKHVEELQFFPFLTIAAAETNGKSIEEKLNAAEEEVKKDFVTSTRTNKEEIKFCGEPAIETMYLGTPRENPDVQSRCRGISFIKEGLYYFIFCGAVSDGYDEATENYLEPMINSFKVL
jgi:hypothetical protein